VYIDVFRNGWKWSGASLFARGLKTFSRRWTLLGFLPWRNEETKIARSDDGRG